MKSTVRKRKDNGKWVMSTMIEGRKYHATLGHGSQRWAQREGDLKLVAMIEAEKKKVPTETLGCLLKMWKQYGKSGQSRKGVLQDSTVRQAHNAFLEVCKIGAGMTEESSLEELTPAAVRKWHSEKLNEETAVSGQRRLASLYAKWVQAKSVIGKRAVTYYSDNQLEVNDWARSLRDLSLPKGKVPAYDLPPDQLIEKTEKAGRELRETDPNLWVIYALGINCGLRAAEIAAMHKSWVVQHRGVMLIGLLERKPWDPESDERIAREGWKPKGSERMVPIHEDMWKAICELSKGLETVLPGSYNRRYQMIVRDFSNWMKNLGWDTRKKSHELRKLFGSRIYTEIDPASAREYLGHDSLDTTTKYYAKLDRPHKLLPQR